MVASAFALLLLIGSCGGDEDGASTGGAAGAGTGGTGRGGAGTGGAGTGGAGAGGATGTGGAGAGGVSGRGGAGAGGSGGAAGSAGSAGASATGGTAGNDAGRTDAGDPDAGSCGTLGAACDVDCPGNFECLQGVCIPNGRANCGGIVAMDCPETFPVCMMCSGCEGGPCFLETEIACLCRGIGRTVFRCGDR